MSDIVKPSFSGTSEASLLSDGHTGGIIDANNHNNINDININIPPQVTIKIALLCMTGTRANLIINSEFLHHYALKCMSPPLLSISAFKQVIYDEWVHALAVAAARQNSEKQLGEDESTGIIGGNSTTTTTTTGGGGGGNGHGINVTEDGVPEWAIQLAGAISPPPTSPNHIRLIYFGKVLDDPATFQDCRLVPASFLTRDDDSFETDLTGGGVHLSTTQSGQPLNSTFVVHLSVRPPSPENKS
ncbi:uncharacterized protein SAPINGB_P002406 [Magnusiomyces paraingens]|uniref:UBL3-like ubiquitin domain-containing protein n=1 Tax=Magnusiomyces paraingens TaxID=2606893 RepID=A0A5E8BDR1_9ASCO|nr:uncharacterized protein SAPINGB_P002406 [Saprochaete ingens]VVT49713.1 unnamed protein product [Saprochaete ingens]